MLPSDALVVGQEGDCRHSSSVRTKLDIRAYQDEKYNGITRDRRATGSDYVTSSQSYL
jgi:hypothetical protein